MLEHQYLPERHVPIHIIYLSGIFHTKTVSQAYWSTVLCELLTRHQEPWTWPRISFQSCDLNPQQHQLQTSAIHYRYRHHKKLRSETFTTSVCVRNALQRSKVGFSISAGIGCEVGDLQYMTDRTRLCTLCQRPYILPLLGMSSTTICHELLHDVTRHAS